MEYRRISREKSEAQYYQIRIKGYISPDWSEWFEGMNIRHEENGNTLISGLVEDQAALFGIFLKIQNLGLTLLSVNNTLPEA